MRSELQLAVSVIALSIGLVSGSAISITEVDGNGVKGETATPKSDGVRNPKFLFNLFNNTMPGVTGGIMPMPGFGGTGASGSTGGSGNLIGTLGTSAILLKGGLIGTLMALKAALIPPIFLAVLIAFLVAGAAFFTCSILDCGSVFGFGGQNLGGFGSPFSSFGNVFNRNSYDMYEQEGRPIYQALENAYKKYGEEENAYAKQRS